MSRYRQLHIRYDIREIFTDTWHFFDIDTVTSLLQTCTKTSLPSVESRLKRVENAQVAVLPRKQLNSSAKKGHA